MGYKAHISSYSADISGNVNIYECLYHAEISKTSELLKTIDFWSGLGNLTTICENLDHCDLVDILMADKTSKTSIAHTLSKVAHCRNSICTYMYMYDLYFIIHMLWVHCYWITWKDFDVTSENRNS